MLKRSIPQWIPVPSLVALVILGVILSLLSPQFLTMRNFQTIADQSAIPWVIVVGLTFVILMGSIDLSVEGVVGAGSMVAALLIANDRNALNFGYWAFPVAVVAGILIGLFAGWSVTRLRIPSFLATIATGYIGLGVAQILFGNQAKPRVLDPRITDLAMTTWWGLSKLTWIALVVVVLGFLVQQFTRFGRYAYAIGGSEEITKLSGIDTRFYRATAVAVAGATFGLAGAMFTARTGVGAVGAGEGQLFLTIAAVVIGGTLLTGGKGGILHSFVGVLIMVCIANGMILVGVNPFWQQLVQGMVVLVAVIATMYRQRQRLRVIK